MEFGGGGHREEMGTLQRGAAKAGAADETGQSHRKRRIKDGKEGEERDDPRGLGGVADPSEDKKKLIKGSKKGFSSFGKQVVWGPSFW